MIVTTRFIFLHLHKSGGTFVGRVLRDLFQDAHQVGYHLPRSHVPAESSHLPMLGTVRNPWAYYVSWYSFQAAMDQPNPLFRACSDEGRLGFSGTVRNLVSLGGQPARLAYVSSRLPARFRNGGINLTQACIAPLGDSSIGFYSFMYRRMYGDLSGCTLLEAADVREGLLAFLVNLGCDLPADAGNRILDQPRANTSQHVHYSRYYDASLRDLVAVHDAELIGRHGYVFEKDPASEDVPKSA